MAKINWKSCKEGVIYQTSDLDQFTDHKFNRLGNTNRKEKLMRSFIQYGGFRPECHLLVDKNGILVDGHNRLAAWRQHCKDNDIVKPIPFMMTTLSFWDFIKFPGPDKWNVDDYSRAYSDYGHKEYTKLREFKQKTGFSWSLAATLLNKSMLRSRTKGLMLLISSGEYTCDNLDNANAFLIKLDDFSPICRGIWKTSEFVMAVYEMMLNSQYDHEWMIDQLERKGPMVEVQLRKRTYLRSLMDIYNFGLEEEEQLRIVETSF